MKSLDALQPELPGQGFQFPGEFEITAMGAANAGLEERMAQIVAALGMPVVDGSLRTRPSTQGHYISVSISFICPSREMYEAAQNAVRADPAVRWTL